MIFSSKSVSSEKLTAFSEIKKTLSYFIRFVKPAMNHGKSGKLIVIYGTNNLGKSTQAKLLLNNLLAAGHRAEYIKYPIYDLTPTGPEINKILRSGGKQKISELELQQLYAQNRFDFEPELKKKLNQGVCVIAEDYIGTGLAWGVTKGAPLEELEKQNQGLIKEDLIFLLDGERFIEGKEKSHLHESSDELMKKNREIHLELAQKYGWRIIDANRPVREVQEEIWQRVKPLIGSLTK
ncbi:hypothetical protein HYZ76_00530 [Candidatus Falkowbacteria bacterium]|nr:hypothetical protein [Candidatus Falkowbacteria bacterium]